MNLIKNINTAVQSQKDAVEQAAAEEQTKIEAENKIPDDKSKSIADYMSDIAQQAVDK